MFSLISFLKNFSHEALVTGSVTAINNNLYKHSNKTLQGNNKLIMTKIVLKLWDVVALSLEVF